MTKTSVINQDLLEPFLLKLREKQPALMLALGDSNMDNTNFTQGGKQWPELLHTELKNHYQAPGLLFLNAAISGNTVLDALKRFETDVRIHQPSLTLFCLGSNDADYLSDEVFETGYLECLDRLQALRSPVLVFTPPPIMERKPEPAHIWQQDEKRQRKVDMIRQMISGRSMVFFDLCQKMREMERDGELNIGQLMCDEVHLNAAGHQLVFRIFAPVFGLSPSFFWERQKTSDPA